MTQNILEMRTHDIDKGFNGVPVLKHVSYLMSARRSPRPVRAKTVPASPPS